MAHIAPSTGSIKRTNRRMALSRVKCGKPVRSTSVTGAITAKKASASSSTRIKISMRECGPLTSATAKAHTGRMRETSFVVSTREIGTRTRSMEEAPSSTRMETDTMDTG